MPHQLYYCSSPYVFILNTMMQVSISLVLWKVSEILFDLKWRKVKALKEIVVHVDQPQVNKFPITPEIFHKYNNNPNCRVLTTAILAEMPNCVLGLATYCRSELEQRNLDQVWTNSNELHGFQNYWHCFYYLVAPNNIINLVRVHLAIGRY